MTRQSLANHVKDRLIGFTVPTVPAGLRDNFRTLDARATAEIERSLREHYFAQPENRPDASLEAYLASSEGTRDLGDHVAGRTHVDRQHAIPWLNDARPLSGSRVLEIGCGTGSSTVALAEQGAIVTGVDVNESNLAVAKDRAAAYGLDIDFLCANACELSGFLAENRFDIIIYFATIEHMTHDERKLSMRQTWDALDPGSLWVIVETPNRLWFDDTHTSSLPFFFWLPDELAFEYSKFSPREGFNAVYREHGDEAMHDFLRRGRGASYHEFDLIIGPAAELRIVSSLSDYLRRRSLLRRVLRRASLNHRFESLLKRIGPDIHPGFFCPALDLIIEKT